MKASGNSASFAPPAPASPISRAAFSTAASAWNGIDAAWTTATLWMLAMRYVPFFLCDPAARTISSLCRRRQKEWRIGFFALEKRVKRRQKIVRGLRGVDVAARGE